MEEVAKLLCVLFGGGFGALARFGVAEIFRTTTRLPGWVAILVVNVAGCFLIGLGFATLAEHMQEIRVHPPAPAVLALEKLSLELMLALGLTGFCGGFTTFSTYSFDSVILWQQGRRGQAGANLILSVALGALAVAAGFALARGSR